MVKINKEFNSRFYATRLTILTSASQGRGKGGRTRCRPTKRLNGSRATWILAWIKSTFKLFERPHREIERVVFVFFLCIIFVQVYMTLEQTSHNQINAHAILAHECMQYSMNNMFVHYKYINWWHFIHLAATQSCPYAIFPKVAH